MDFLKKLLNLLKPYQRQIRWLLFYTLIFEILKLINPYIFKEIIDELISFGSSSIKTLIYLVALLLVTNVVVSWIYRWIDFRRFDFLLDLNKYLPNAAHQKLLNLSLGYHERENTGNKIIKIRRGVDELDNFLSNAVWDFFPISLQVIVTFIFILFVDWPLALIFAAAIPVFMVATNHVNKKINPWRKDVQHNYEKSAGLMGQSIININTVQSFAQERYEMKTHYRVLEKIFGLESKIWRKILNYNFLRNTILDLGRVATIGFAIFQVASGKISPGSLVLFLTLSERVYTSLHRLSRIYDRIMESIPAVNRLDSLLKEESSIARPENPLKLNLEGGVEFKNVSFGYVRKKDALDDVSFKIKSGELIALVGPSGAGKTTIVKLLYRHFDVSSGQILIDGAPLEKLDLYHYRRQLGIVTQDIDIFNDTVAANISYARPKAPLSEIINAAKIANAHEFVTKMSNGYDTLVGERGVKLSGGQKQRVGIARAILADPKILIFDEATSSLDSESELLIQQSLAEISKNRTMIVIAHRLSTIRRASRILVFEAGRLVEQGSHAELQSNHGLYAKLHALQISGEVR